MSSAELHLAAGDETKMSGIRIGYLISRYPAISHTFILREVLELKRLRFDIQVASINEADRPHHSLTRTEQKEASVCFYVKRVAVERFGWDFLCTLASNPSRLISALGFALGVSRLDLRKAVKNLLYLAEAIILTRWMQRLKLEHLHVHFATPASTVALFAAKLAPIAFSITVHGPDEFYNVDDYLLRQKCLHSRFLCTISHYAASQLMNLMRPEAWHKLHVIPLGVDPAVFLPEPKSRLEDGFRLLCVGRLVPEKGQHILLEALKQLLEEGRNVKLVLVGDGRHRPSLEAFVRQKQMESSVTFAGAINQDEIRALYREADVFVLASFAEGVPVVLMEAMAMEIPCIATWVAGIPELIGDGSSGLLVPPSCVVALRSAIVRLMDDEELRRSIARGGRRRVIEKYDLTANVARLGRVFEEQLGRAA